MDSKNVIILILGLLAMVLLISSEVSARDLSDTSFNTKNVVLEKINEGIYGFGRHNGLYPSIGGRFPGNNGGYFGGYLGNGGRYNGGYPYYNGGYTRGFPINVGGYNGGYARGFPVIVGGYGNGVGYRGNRGGYNVGYGRGYPNSVSSYIGGPYIVGQGKGYLNHGSRNGEVVDVKTKGNSHN